MMNYNNAFIARQIQVKEHEFNIILKQAQYEKDEAMRKLQQQIIDCNEKYENATRAYQADLMQIRTKYEEAYVVRKTLHIARIVQSNYYN